MVGGPPDRTGHWGWLLTASVTWILQIYPALGRRRALAVRLRLLADQQDVAALPTPVLHALVAEPSAESWPPQAKS